MWRTTPVHHKKKSYRLSFQLHDQVREPFLLHLSSLKLMVELVVQRRGIMKLS